MEVSCYLLDMRFMSGHITERNPFKIYYVCKVISMEFHIHVLELNFYTHKCLVLYTFEGTFSPAVLSVDIVVCIGVAPS